MFSREEMRRFVLPTDLVKLVFNFRDDIVLFLDLEKLEITGKPFVLFKAPIFVLPISFYDYWAHTEYLMLP